MTRTIFHNRPRSGRSRSYSLWLPALLLCALLSLLYSAPAVAEPRIALVIGNGKYGKEIGSLVNPPNDANLMADRLSKLGFKVSKLVNGDQKAMKRAIVDFGEALTAAGPDAVGLFFYAGHGIAVDGANYLIPVGAQLTREADAEIEAVNADWVLKQMQFADARVNIIILDACRNNPLPRSMRSASRGLERMDAPAGSFVGYSTAPGEVAADGDGKNSPYTSALVEELAKPGIAIEEAFRNVRVDVMAKTDSQQVPWDSSSLTGAFYFQPGAKAAVEPASAEEKFWDDVKSSQDASEFDAYLTRFPDGAHADLARSRAARLRATGGKQTERTAAAPAEAPVQTASAVAEPAPEPAPAPEPVTEVASLAPVANSDPNAPIQLSTKVSSQLRTYLAQLQGRNAAFAVSPDGQFSGSYTCEDVGQCVPGKKGVPQNTNQRYPLLTALTKCKNVSKQECVVVLIRDDERHSYALAE